MRKIEEIYKKSIIYILPSYNEGMPMSVLEAMSYGLPVISTNVGSISLVVKEENGFVVEPGDIELITTHILNILKGNIDIELMAKRNVEKIKRHYNVYNSLEQLMVLYEKIENLKNKLDISYRRLYVLLFIFLLAILKIG